jgi:transcriptional regulator with XRE-family HTH domain
MENKFPRILKELRLEQKLTIEKLSDKTGLPFSSLQCYEAGSRTPAYPVIITHAQFFGVTCGQLLGTEEL